MKKVLLLTAAMCLVASMAFAQGGALVIAQDAAGTDCNLQDLVAGIAIWNVVHIFTPGATASQFSAPSPACNFAVYLADQQIFPVTIGNSQTGVAVGYGACLASPILVLGIQYFAQGLTAPCCPYPVLPDPASTSGTIEVVDCASQLITGVSGQAGIINSNSTCPCVTVPTSENTWGGVKALYQ